MKHLLQLLLVLAVINVLGIGGLWYGFTVMQNKKNTEGQLQSDILGEQQKWQKLAVLRRTLVLAEKDRAAYSKYFYDSSEESQIKFINEIEKLSVTTGATVKTNSFDVSQQDPKSFRGTFTITGSWEQVYYVLRLAEEYPGRIVVNSFSARENGPDLDHKYSYWVGTMSVELMSIKATQ